MKKIMAIMLAFVLLVGCSGSKPKEKIDPAAIEKIVQGIYSLKTIKSADIEVVMDTTSENENENITVKLEGAYSVDSKDLQFVFDISMDNSALGSNMSLGKFYFKDFIMYTDTIFAGKTKEADTFSEKDLQEMNDLVSDETPLDEEFLKAAVDKMTTILASATLTTEDGMKKATMKIDIEKLMNDEYLKESYDDAMDNNPLNSITGDVEQDIESILITVYFDKDDQVVQVEMFISGNTIEDGKKQKIEVLCSMKYENIGKPSKLVFPDLSQFNETAETPEI